MSAKLGMVMFENYLDDVDTYLNLEKFFLEFFDSKLIEMEKDRNTFRAPFYKTTFSNGMPFMDGNPIFSAKNDVKNTVLRLVIDDDVSEVSSFDKDDDFGNETVVVGNIGSLETMCKEAVNWISRQ